MKELQRKQQIRHLLYSWPSLVIVAVLTLLIAKGAYGIMKIERQNANRVSALEKETEHLVGREGDLKEEIARLQTQEGIIEEIKRKFSVTRPGEHVAIIIDPKIEATSSSRSSGSWLKSILGAIIFWK